MVDMFLNQHQNQMKGDVQGKARLAHVDSEDDDDLDDTRDLLNDQPASKLSKGHLRKNSEGTRKDGEGTRENMMPFEKHGRRMK